MAAVLMKLKAKNLKRKSIFILFCIFSFKLYALNFTLYAIPAYAQGVDIGDQFGFGKNFGNSLGDITSKLVIPVFSIITFVVTWYFLWGAWDWLISEGDKQKVADARNKITQAIVGFLILILSFFLLQFVLDTLFKVDLGIIGI